MGHGLKELVEVGVVESRDFESHFYEIRRGVWRERNSGEVVEDDGRGLFGDAADVRSGGAGVVRGRGDENSDGE